MPMRSVFVRDVFDKKRALPRMVRHLIGGQADRQSWAPENLYNLWQRTSPDGPLYNETDFTRTTLTLFQQRWKSKRLIRGYHGDHIGTTKFERWFLPSRLPSIHATPPSTGLRKEGEKASRMVEGRERGGGRNRDDRIRSLELQDKRERVPVGTMMFAEVERRLDVLVFRACFATSVWQAKSMVVHGKVKLNGEIVSIHRPLACALSRRVEEDCVVDLKLIHSAPILTSC